MRIASYLSVIFHGAQCHDGIILERQLRLVPYTLLLSKGYSSNFTLSPVAENYGSGTLAYFLKDRDTIFC